MSSYNEKEVMEIDLIRLGKVLLRHIFLIIFVTVLCGLIATAGALNFVTPMYKASVLMYVNNSSISIGSSSLSISSGELSAAKTLVDTYCTILMTRLTLEDVINEAGLDYNYETLSSMISSGSVNNTEIFKITVTSPNAKEACNIANTIARILPDKIASVVDGSSVRTVDLAVVPTKASSPSYTRYTLIGALIGLIAVCAFLVIRDLVQDTIDSEDYLMEAYPEYPVLAVIPLEGEGGKVSKYGKKYDRYYYYSEGKRRKAK